MGQCRVIRIPQSGQTTDDKQVPDSLLGFALVLFGELFVSDEEAADRWFKCRLFFITLDEKSGAEKKTASFVLVQAADLRDAVRKLDEGMKGTMADYQIGAVTETAIVDVYPYGSTA